LELIEKEKLAIAEISLARVADDYLAYVRGMVSPDPEELAEFLVVAAHLCLIKSRSLLPSLIFSEEEEASLDDLERRLAILQMMRRAARELHGIEQKGLRIASREAYLGLAPVFYAPPSLGATELAEAFAAVIALIPKPEKLAEEKLKRIVSLEDKISHIRGVLQDMVERRFSEIVAGAKEKVDIVVSFLALLELARQKFIDLKQDAHFGEIMIKKIL
jgi:segregation and condensation protein A